MYAYKKELTPLDNNQLVQLAPSVGASSPINTVSRRYDFVPTLNVVNLLRNDSWLPVSVQESRALNKKRGYQKHLIRFTRPELNLNGERIDLILTNSHDAGSAFHLDAAVWRQICGNGLMVSSNIFSFAHRHIGFDHEAFIESAKQISSQAYLIAEKIEALKSIEMTPDERGIFAIAAHSLVYNNLESAPIQPQALLSPRRNFDQKTDLWTTYNVVQENIIKGNVRTSRNYQLSQRQAGAGKITRKTRPIKAIDKDIKLNKALWTLTEKMQELKQA